MVLDFNDAKPQKKKRPARQSANPMEARQSFIEAMAAHGVPMADPALFNPSGRIERYQVEGERQGDGSGWYVYYDGDIAAGSFGSWRYMVKEKWCSHSTDSLSPQQRAEWEAKLKEAREARIAMEEQNREVARIRANSIWENSTPAAPDHPYLAAKQVSGPNLRQTIDSKLIVPMHDLQGNIYSLQFIPNDGKEKRYLSGGAKEGNFCYIPGESDIIYIAEGYATGASINLATSKAVFIAFDAGNLLSVGQVLRAAYPQARIIIAADNDQWTTQSVNNPGVTMAQEAAATISGEAMWPTFASIEGKPTDFNDLHVREGLDRVHAQLTPDQAMDFDGVPSIFNWGLDAFHGDPPEYEWVVDKLIPRSAATLLAAMGDTGKGYLSLDLALKVAAGPETTLNFNKDANIGWMGNHITTHGSVVIFSAEDDKHEIHRRLKAIDPEKKLWERAKDKLLIVPLPNDGGPFSLVEQGQHGATSSVAYHKIMDQLRRIPDLALVNFDPLASFVSADINADPAAGAFTTGLLSSMAGELNAGILVAHHMGKGSVHKPIRSPEEARSAIRGTTALVDGVRCALALWPVGNKKADTVCHNLQTDFRPNKVYEAAIVKCNGPGDRTVKTMVRGDNGLLISREMELKNVELSFDDLLGLMEESIKEAAEAGRPFSKTGATGVYERREELDSSIRDHGGRDKIEGLTQRLLEDGRVVRCTYKTTVAKWLDVPQGPFAIGIGTIEPGMLQKSKK